MFESLKGSNQILAKGKVSYFIRCQRPHLVANFNKVYTVDADANPPLNVPLDGALSDHIEANSFKLISEIATVYFQDTSFRNSLSWLCIPKFQQDHRSCNILRLTAGSISKLKLAPDVNPRVCIARSILTFVDPDCDNCSTNSV